MTTSPCVAGWTKALSFTDVVASSLTPADTCVSKMKKLNYMSVQTAADNTS